MFILLTLFEFIQKCDNFSNDIVKNSFIGNNFISLKNKVSILSDKNKSKIISVILFVSLCILFASLSFPQFQDDRFGIGLMVLFCFAIFLINFLLSKDNKVSFNVIDLLVLTFLLIVIISTFSSYFFKESLVGLFKYIIFILFYFLIKTFILSSQEKLYLDLWTFLFFCAVITSLIGVYQYMVGVEPLATWEDPSYENIHTRVYSTLGNPNTLAVYLSTILPVGIVVPFKRKSSVLSKIFFLVCSCLVLLCLIFTGSRGAYLGLLTGFVFSLIVFLKIFFKKVNSKSLMFLTLFGLGIAIALFLFPIFTERLSTIFTLREHSSNNFRVNVWLACLKMLKDNWFIGIGPGNATFVEAYGLYMMSGFSALAAYNIFLELAIETGILGCLVFLFIFLISFLKLHYLFWEKGNILAASIFVSLLGVLIQGMVDTQFFRPQIFLPFWFLIASIAKIESKEGDF